MKVCFTIPSLKKTNQIFEASLKKLKSLISMINSRHAAIKAYLTSGQLPNDLPSTVSNFKREASHYEIGSNGVLKREGKIVALYKDRKAIFNCYHATHSGNHSKHSAI